MARAISKGSKPPLAVRLPQEKIDRLRAIADRDGVYLSSLVEDFIDEGLSKREKPAAGQGTGLFG